MLLKIIPKWWWPLLSARLHSLQQWIAYLHPPDHAAMAEVF
jgi:hypothetical protein